MIQLLFLLFLWKGRIIINVDVVALTKCTVNVNLKSYDPVIYWTLILSSRILLFCFMIPLNQKIISSLITFQSLNRHIL